jgi:hypothetical protein
MFNCFLKHVYSIVATIIAEKPNLSICILSLELFIAMNKLPRVSRNIDISIFAYVISFILLSPPLQFLFILFEIETF